MQPGNDDPPYQMRYRSLLAENEDAPTDELDCPYYNLRDEVTLRVGDKFFDIRERVLLTVVDVLEKYTIDNRGNEFGSMTPLLRVRDDDPEDGRPDGMRDHGYRASQFIEDYRHERLIPHKANDYVPEEIQR